MRGCKPAGQITTCRSIGDYPVQRAWRQWLDCSSTERIERGISDGKGPGKTADEEGARRRAAGILPVQAIRGLIDAGQVKLAEPPLPNQLQPASLDLRLGAMAYPGAGELPAGR